MRFIDPEQAFREMLEADPLRDYYTDWNDVGPGDVEAFSAALEAATEERVLQRFLAENPQVLVQYLGGGHGRWVIPHQRLGTQHETDFLIGDRDSMGRSWVAVELEGPQRPLFTTRGDPSQFLWHAIRQIIDWRIWLEQNRDYAVRVPSDGGLGLEHISTTTAGLVVIGRRGQGPPDRPNFRRALRAQLDIEVHTYDWLLERLQGHVLALAKWAEQQPGARLDLHEQPGA